MLKGKNIATEFLLFFKVEAVMELDFCNWRSSYGGLLGPLSDAQLIKEETLKACFSFICILDFSLFCCNLKYHSRKV